MAKITNAKFIFDSKIAPLLEGKTSDDTIEIFSNTSFNFFYNLPPLSGIEERKLASIVGFKDEFFVDKIVNQVIKENNLCNYFYCKKVTANLTSGIKGRTINLNGSVTDLTFGGDCVIFSIQPAGEVPIMIIECKEYIDMIRMKELIGESKIIKDNISNSTTNFPDIKFWVFANVLELTEGWSYLFNNSNIKHRIDEVFIARKGKRKDKENRPQKSELIRFRDGIKNFLISYKY